MRAALVHGTRNGKSGDERIFAALSRQPLQPGSGMALKLLLPFIDTALRRMPPAPARPMGRDDGCAGAVPIATLSNRAQAVATLTRVPVDA